MPAENDDDFTFTTAVRRLENGDFSWAEPLFQSGPANGRPKCQIIDWVESGKFNTEPRALAEALSAACFNGYTEVARFLLDRGVDPAEGCGTGLNAVHWAANRGQLETVRLLLSRKAPLELRNMYGGTVLGCTVWSAVYEPHPDHVRIIEAVLEAGANVAEAEYPSGRDDVDEVLRRYGAEKSS
jgi:hypothetical protein